MKKYIAGILLLAAVFLAASCVLQTGGTDETGSVSMNFALTPGSKAITENQVRVWVYSANVLIRNKNAGTLYYSGTLTAGKGSVTIENLPPGSGYRIVVAAGENDPAVGNFITSRFGTSTLFNVSAGVEVGVSLALTDLTMVSAEVLENSNVKSVVSVFGGVAASTSDERYWGENAVGITKKQDAPPETVFNSLSTGTDESESEVLLVNKSNGVDKISTSESTTGSPVAVFADGVPLGGVRQSGAFNGVYFYQAEKEFGGKVPGSPNWLQVNLNIAGMTGRPVMDFVVTQNPTTEAIVGFFATRIVGAMRMGQDFIEADLEDPLQEILDGDSPLLKFFGAELPFIQAFGYLGGANSTLFIGTKNGVYQTTAEFGASAIGAATIVPGTKGLNVTKIVTNADGAAYMAETEVVVLKNNLVYLLPFINGLTGDINDVAWMGTKLYVAGAKGLAEIETSTW